MTAALLVRAWIEITRRAGMGIVRYAALLVRAWIEIRRYIGRGWELESRSPRESVD